MTKRVGKPPGEKKQSLLKAVEMLLNFPSYIPRLTKQDLHELKTMWQREDLVKQEILKQYKHGPSTPDKHAYLMASCTPEFVDRIHKDLLKADENFKAKAMRVVKTAGRAHSIKKADRRFVVLTKNHTLVSKIGSTRRYTVHTVAKLIHHQWDGIQDVQRLVGEEGLMSRGDGGPKVSIRTLERWLTN